MHAPALPPQVKVWLGEGHTLHHYVLSRFLISRMLTVTRIPSTKVSTGNPAMANAFAIMSWARPAACTPTVLVCEGSEGSLRCICRHTRCVQKKVWRCPTRALAHTRAALRRP